MEIRVLGLVEQLVDGAPRTVPGTGERELLALLALSDRVVASSTLIDALWGEDLPANPDNALQVRVSKLRRALAALGLPWSSRPVVPDTSWTSTPGKSTRCASRSAWPSPGRAPTGSGRRRGRLPEALALWRGQPLGEFGPPPGPPRGRPADRAVPVSPRGAGRPRAGRGTPRGSDRRPRGAHRHPLRERLHSRLMLALYRAAAKAMPWPPTSEHGTCSTPNWASLRAPN